MTETDTLSHFDSKWKPIVKICNNSYGRTDCQNDYSIVRGTFVFNGFGIACGTDKGEIFINETETGKRLMSLEKKDLYEIKRKASHVLLNEMDIGVNDIRSDENGNYLIVCFSTGHCYIYDLRIGLNSKNVKINDLCISNFNEIRKGPCTCTAIPYNWEYNYVYIGGYDGYIKSWDLRKENEYVTHVLAHEGPLTSIEISPNSCFKNIDDNGLNGVLSSTSFDGKIRMWKLNDLKLLKTFSGPNGSECTLHSTFSKEIDFNGSYNLFCIGNKSSCVWRINKDESTEKINIVNWNIDKLDDNQLPFSSNNNILIPKYTGFSEVHNDTYIIPRIIPDTNSELNVNPFGSSDAIVFNANAIYNGKKHINVKNSCSFIGNASNTDSIITSVSVFSRNNYNSSYLNNDLLLTTSSYPNPSCVIWCNNTK
ncbi:WD-40 repeat protein [Cryptosporidium ryanae]|uniref:WD-40 repeat protein n=1 Tax=Cryptosporidium ryanae TaxID=515981 RepID=UPI00351A8E31|nr:WD-40 repeat protein [Cryptosporidium ryanae]